MVKYIKEIWRRRFKSRSEFRPYAVKPCERKYNDLIM